MINKDTTLCISLSARASNFGTRFHNYLYEKLGLNFIYKAFKPTDIDHAIAGVRGLGIRGCAVSMPYKESVMKLVDEILPSAAVIGAVNTIVNDDGFLRAYNTDYIAIVKLVEKYRLNPADSVIVQGSGGMAKAVVAAFKNSGFTNVKIYARNQTTGQALAQAYGYEYIADLSHYTADILVNVTPIGMAGGADAENLAYPSDVIDTCKVAFDVVAMPADTPFLNYANRVGKQCISGAEVIVLQAVEQFELYTHIRPSDELIRDAAAFARLG